MYYNKTETVIYLIIIESRWIGNNKIRLNSDFTQINTATQLFHTIFILSLLKSQSTLRAHGEAPH